MPATLARPPRTPDLGNGAPALPRHRSVRRLARALTVAGAAVLAGSTGLLVARYVPSRAVPLQPDTWAMVTAFTDLAAPATLLATALATAALVVDRRRRRRRARIVLVALCLVSTGAQVLVLAPRWVPASAPATATSFKVLALNARLGRADPDAVVAAAREADVVVLTEVTAPLGRALVAAGLTDRLPHRSTGRLPSGGAGGTAVFSRFPLTGTSTLSPHLVNQSWVCRVDLPGLEPPLTVVAVHPTRPRSGGTRWLTEQQDLRAALPTSGPRLLAGDFNAVASHPTQRALARDGWRSAVDEAGAGWVPTYPADSSHVPPMIDIDHVLVAGSLQATRARSVRVPGTDHLGLLVTVAVVAT